MTSLWLCYGFEITTFGGLVAVSRSSETGLALTTSDATKALIDSLHLISDASSVISKSFSGAS